MPNVHYIKGRAAEYAVRNTLEPLGYHVIRAAASQGIFDICAYHNTGRDALAIQVKRGEKPYPCDYKGCINLPVAPGIIKMLVWYPNGLKAARVLYCADSNGPCPLPEWCASVRWLEGEPPKQSAMKLR